MARSATGFGGCCYLEPETGHQDMLLVDPITLQVSQTWKGCVAAYASPLGSFACTGRVLTAHLPDGSTRTVTPTPPVTDDGWAQVDDSGRRVIFAVVHSRGAGGGGCPCKLDTEANSLADGSVTVLADQMLPDAPLPDGRVIMTSAPAVPDEGPHATWILSPDGTRVQLGPVGAQFMAVIALP